MRNIETSTELVAYCGLYCGACKSYLTERCPGCHKNEKATWCAIRNCCMEKGRSSCVQCTEFPNPRDCKKFNNLVSKFFAVILRSNRAACIEQIRRLGLEGHAQAMAASRSQTIKR